jgi:Domain of unknown function (DUF5655)
MAKDEEEEREFLAELKARSGRNLDEWMAAITAQGFADKNHTIDWLRAQGFPFARASWLERIHNNGGRPIYLDQGTRRGETAPQPAASATAGPRPPSQREAAQLEALLAAAKGYRPLYWLLEAAIRKALPGVVMTAKATHIAIGAPRAFAALTLHASELRLGLALGARPYDGHLQKARLKGVAAAISHMLVLTDARQVNDELLGLIKEASALGKEVKGGESSKG